MKEVTVLIVDDSPLFVALLTRLLEEKGFRVIGGARSREEAVDAVRRLRPDIVTMDLIMPGEDGLECARAIHAVNPRVSVIIVSSLLDDETVRAAREIRVAGFVHKPVDIAELTAQIRRITDENARFEELNRFYYRAFKEAMIRNTRQYFKISPKYLDRDTADVIHESRGVAIVSGLIGKYRGRVILDLPGETARRISSVLLGKETHSKEEILSALNKMTLSFMETARAALNRENDTWSVRFSPPVFFYGELILMARSHLDTVTSEIAETLFGDIYINVGFAKEGSL